MYLMKPLPEKSLTRQPLLLLLFTQKGNFDID